MVITTCLVDQKVTYVQNRGGAPFLPTTNSVVEFEKMRETLGVFQYFIVKLGVQGGGLYQVRDQIIGNLHEFLVDLFIIFGISIAKAKKILLLCVTIVN